MRPKLGSGVDGTRFAARKAGAARERRGVEVVFAGRGRRLKVRGSASSREIRAFQAGKGVRKARLTRAELLLAFRAVVSYMAARNDSAALAQWRAWVLSHLPRQEEVQKPLTVSLGELGLTRWREEGRTA